jgi:hypothetical protein
MISVKCPTCGLVDWNLGNCKRCETSLVGLGADGESHGHGYFRGASEEVAQARTVRTARLVVAVCAAVVLGLTALGALYIARRPAKKEWFWSFYRSEPTVAEIFARNLDAGGGGEQIARLRSFRAEGRLKLTGGEAARVAAAVGGDVTIVMHAKEPGKVETEIEMGPPREPDSPFAVRRPSLDADPPFGPPAPSAPTIRLSLRRGFDGSRGWEYVERTVLTPGSTVPIKQYSSRELDGEELERMKRYLQPTGLSRLSDEYTSLRLDGRVPVTWGIGDGLNAAGQELIDKSLRGHEAYVVSGVNRGGREESFYFDTETGLLLRVDFGAEDGEGEPVRFACAFGDYKNVGGLKLPHRFHVTRGEESVTLTFEKYFPNDPIPDSTFERPE